MPSLGGNLHKDLHEDSHIDNVVHWINNYIPPRLVYLLYFDTKVLTWDELPVFVI